MPNKYFALHLSCSLIRTKLLDFLALFAISLLHIWPWWWGQGIVFSVTSCNSCRFVEEMTYEPPCLLELAGRVVKTKNVKYSPEELPACLVEYLDSAQHCVNPKCSGLLLRIDMRLIHLCHTSMACIFSRRKTIWLSRLSETSLRWTHRYTKTTRKSWADQRKQ